ncbi:MAG: phosphopantetheine-binding protein [Candidatus Lernaella stagnicola]|nr:phosphopantetheine-binding protein [Candidatus Lernaella stagnicola]
MDLETKVREIICDVLSCQVEDLSDDAFLSDDLGMTPDDLEEFVAMAQEEYEIEIPDVDAEEWETVANVVSYIHDKLENA